MTRSADIAAQAPAAPPAEELVAHPTFEQLYRMHFDFVWRCLRRLGVHQAHLDDAAQDVFLVVHRRLHEYQPRVSARAWLFAITRRVAHDYRRRESRKGGGLPLSQQIPTRRPDALHDVECAEAAEIVLRFLETLKNPQREAFVLSELEQLTAPEVASATGTRVSTVYTRVQAARQRLTRFMQRHYPELSSPDGGSHGG